MGRDLLVSSVSEKNSASEFARNRRVPINNLYSERIQTFFFTLSRCFYDGRYRRKGWFAEAECLSNWVNKFIKSDSRLYSQGVGFCYREFHCNKKKITIKNLRKKLSGGNKGTPYPEPKTPRT